jgi:hypothetical protein
MFSLSIAGGGWGLGIRGQSLFATLGFVDDNGFVDIASLAFCKLGRHDICNWALTGGFAFEIHSRRLGLDAPVRELNDIDFVTLAFGSIPGTLSQDFLFRHVHPLAPPGKTLAQLIDPKAALRIDVFRACGETMSRTVRVDSMQVVALEDLVARAARLLLDLAESVPVASKHARDYLRFVGLVDSTGVEAAWRDHRKPAHPATFRETKATLQDLIPAKASLLIVPRYSQDPNQSCPLCESTAGFQLADPNLVLSLLGYC